MFGRFPLDRQDRAVLAAVQHIQFVYRPAGAESLDHGVSPLYRKTLRLVFFLKISIVHAVMIASLSR
jgi:hypothetical protein